MSMKFKPEIDESKLTKNIFIGKLVIPVSEVTDVHKFVLGTDGIKNNKVYHIERQQYVKVYYAEGAKELIYKLSPAGKCLFLFIIHHLEVGKDWFVFDRGLYMQKNGIKSINTVKGALTELWDMELICPTAAYPTTVYWINPKYFFCGNRPKCYPGNLDIK